MVNPTNSQLADKIGKLETAMIAGFERLDKRINPIHDFMKEQEGYAKGVAASKGNSNVILTKDLVKIILALIALATVLAGARSLT